MGAEPGDGAAQLGRLLEELKWSPAEAAFKALNHSGLFVTARRALNATGCRVVSLTPRQRGSRQEALCLRGFALSE